jgi:signal transduction histidine kinase
MSRSREQPLDLGGGDELGDLGSAIARMCERLDRRVRSMAAFRELASTSVLIDPAETFARLSRTVAEAVGAEKAWIAVWEPASRSLAFTPPGYGIPDEVLHGISVGLDGEGLALLAFRTGETFVSQEIEKDAKASRVLAEKTGVRRNAVFNPLRTEAGTIGVLVVCDKDGPFFEDDLAAISSHADQAALILRNGRLYEELQRSYEKLREAYRSQDHFLQNINHELRTPLTAILGWSEILREDQPDAETTKTALEQVHRSAHFLLNLISDLLDVARFEDGKTSLNIARVDLRHLLDDTLEPILVMAGQKGLKLVTKVPEALEVQVECDPVRFKQVLWNLVHNAVKFTPPGGRVEVTARVQGEKLEVVVKDNGVGITPPDLARIFERFRQGDGSASRAYRGTGIGLFLAREFVGLHGGEIEVESRPGEGACFRFWIPVKREAAPASKTAASGGL